jgi:hypothetical protein
LSFGQGAMPHRDAFGRGRIAVRLNRRQHLLQVFRLIGHIRQPDFDGRQSAAFGIEVKIESLLVLGVG